MSRLVIPSAAMPAEGSPVGRAGLGAEFDRAVGRAGLGAEFDRAVEPDRDLV
jgi:hypothetical protein